MAGGNNTVTATTFIVNDDVGTPTTIGEGGLTNDPTLTFNGVGTVPNGGAASTINIWVVINGVIPTAPLNSTPVPLNPDRSWTFTEPAELQDGTYAYYVTDGRQLTFPTGGNADTKFLVLNGSAKVFDVLLDATAPALTIGSEVVANNQVTLSGTAADAHSSGQVQVFDGQTLLGTATVTGGNWTFTTTQLTTGDHTFNVSSTDLAGNVGTQSATVHVVCFLGETLIATPDGDQPIALLSIGDLITLADGRQVPIKWIGRMSVELNQFNRHTATPVLVRAGALGNGVPRRDLYTSYHHGFALDGTLVIAGLLVNGASIIQCSDWEEPVVTYYQIEVEGHELMVAEGAPVETFGEDGDNRALFDNDREFHALYPDAVPAQPMPLPRVVARRQLPRSIAARIDDAAVELSFTEFAAAA